MSEILYYFGTSLNKCGHYFWELDDRLNHSEIYFQHIPFDPEQLTDHLKRNGEWVFHNYKGYSILAISGSCTDTRKGSKSVFWVKEKLSQNKLIERIINTSMAVTIINQMPFTFKPEL